jgi:hypothetical protein
MVLTDVAVAFLVAVTVSLALVWVFGWRHPRRADSRPLTWMFVFLILFLGAWAGGLWLTPIGPLLWGTYWIPSLVVAILIAFVIAAVTPSRPPRGDRVPGERPTAAGRHAEAQKRVNANVLFGGFFWILIIALMAAVFMAYSLRN